MAIQLILIALIGAWSSYVSPAVISEVTNGKDEIQANFRDFFNSIMKKDIKKAGTYRDILEQAAERGQQAFDTMKEEVRIGQWRKAHEQNHLYFKNRSVDGKVMKRERTTHENTSETVSMMDESHCENSTEIRASWRTLMRGDHSNEELEHPAIIEPSFIGNKNFKSNSNGSRQSRQGGGSSAEIRTGWRTFSPNDFANQEPERPTVIDPSFFGKETFAPKSNGRRQSRPGAGGSAEIRAGWRTFSPNDFANQGIERPTVIDPAFFQRFPRKNFKSKSNSSRQSEYEGESSAEIRAGWRTFSPYNDGDHGDHGWLPLAAELDPTFFQEKFLKPEHHRSQPKYNHSQSDYNNETDVPYYGNGTHVVINHNYYRTRDAVASTASEKTARPYYANGSEVVINYAYYRTREDSCAPNTTLTTEELSTTDKLTSRLNPNEMYSPHLHDKYFPESRFDVTEAPYRANGTGIVINYAYFRTKDDLPPWLMDTSDYDRKKRDIDPLNDTSYDDESWALHQPLSEEAMQRVLETSTLSASEEKLYRYYETKTWPSTLKDSSVTTPYPFEDSEEGSEGSVSKPELTSSQFEDSEEVKTTAKEKKRGKFNHSTTFTPAQLQGRTKKKSIGKTTKKSLTRVDVVTENPSVSSPSKSDEKGQRTSKATEYTGRYTFTHSMPTPPPSLSESQEKWYAAYDERAKTTLSWDEFRPGDVTWWRSWSTTHWSNFTWTTYPPYHPFNATTTPKDSLLPIYHFRSFDEWKNYTIERERSRNATVNTSDTESNIESNTESNIESNIESKIESDEEYDTDYYMDQSDDRKSPQSGQKKIAPHKMTLPNIFLTPSEKTTKKHKERPLRGRGKLSQSKKLPKRHPKHKYNDGLYEDFVKGRKHIETEEED